MLESFASTRCLYYHPGMGRFKISWCLGGKWLLAFQIFIAATGKVLPATNQIDSLAPYTNAYYYTYCNSIYEFKQKITPLSHSHSSTNSKPHDLPLQLMVHLGKGEVYGGYDGMRGLAYMANDWKTPGLLQTNIVDIFATSDHKRIVVMVEENGPIYNSTNSGLTWKTITRPGYYEFLLTMDKGEDSGYYAAATIHPASQNPFPVNTFTNWYARAINPDGSQLILTGNFVQAAPALNIHPSASGLTVSWPSQFTNYVLQMNNDLSGTNWLTMTNPVTVNGLENQVIVSPAHAHDFFRLVSHSP